MTLYYLYNKLVAKKDKKNQGLVNPETKNSITAILLLGIAAILILAAFQKAGPVGSFLHLILNNLFGWGYYLLPTIAILVAVFFFFSHQRVLIGASLLGSALFIIAGLGMIDMIFPGQGGWIGKGVGFLQYPFGYTASLVLTTILIVASLLITFNASIKFKKQEKPGKEELPKFSDEVEDVVIAEPETRPVKSKAPEKNDEEEIEDDDPDVRDGLAIPAVNKKSPARQKTYSNYVPPAVELLKSSVEKPTAGDLRANANIIKRTLESFGIPVEMGEINIGPKVTRYTLKPAEGVKLSKILALNSDLALALAAHPIRIEAPIPGKSLVGIEVPNKSAAIVRLGNLINYPEFRESGPLAFVLGRGVSGEPIMADIEKMPHLLVAGATGSGKSVAIHALISSLLYKNSPGTLRFAMIDPKRVELSVYGNLPHMIAPVITDGKKAIGLLRWAIKEMERRYEVLLGAGARDVRSYNQKNKEVLPYIVIVVDEMADLMAAYGKEVESSIVRLAQMARATGIHLVLATQRPSVEVITGLIKANITSRMALQVASQVDSRTILDTAGAEKLLGGGDMLFMSYEFSKPKRIQGAYISEEEIKKISSFIEDHNEGAEWAAGATSENIPLPMKENGSDFLEDLGSEEGADEMFDEAVQVVSEAQKASASLLQRRLKVGYARAARLLDLMEEKGLIGPGEGAKPREVYISAEKSEPPLS